MGQGAVSKRVRRIVVSGPIEVQVWGGNVGLWLETVVFGRGIDTWLCHVAAATGMWPECGRKWPEVAGSRPSSSGAASSLGLWYGKPYYEFDHSHRSSKEAVSLDQTGE